MKTITTVLMVIVMIMGITAITQADDSYNTKVLFHGAKKIGDNFNWKLAGWSVFPNIGNGPVLMIAGLGYSVENKWDVEVMAGSFTKDRTGQSVIDIRASYDVLDPIHAWTNVEYFPKSDEWYTYLDINYRIGKLGLIGVETENMHFSSQEDNLSFGPRLVLPFQNSKLVLIGTYQFHNGDHPNQIWSRAVLNF